MATTETSLDQKAAIRATVFDHLAGMVLVPTVKALWDRGVFGLFDGPGSWVGLGRIVYAVSSAQLAQVVAFYTRWLDLPATQPMYRARTLFEKAAAQNHPGALERMGAFAQEGRGGSKDTDAAKAYYEKAAALGDEEAKKALERVRCPYVIKDKRGGVVTNLCF